jgi:hypothetical protein
MRVRFPMKAADIELLAAKLMEGDVVATGAAQKPVVGMPKPSTLSQCSGMVTFVVPGANIWRSTEVFLGGARAKSVSVLPDMEGVAATFDVGELFTPRSRRGASEKEAGATTDASDKTVERRVLKDGAKVRLVVATRNGLAFHDIAFVRDATKGENCGNESQLQAPED